MIAYQLICQPLQVTAVLLTVLAGLGSGGAQEAPRAAAVTVESHLGRGYDALRQDQYELAANEFRAALKLDPTLIQRAQFPLAVALFEMHQASEARREFESLRRELGDHPNILYYLGRLDLESRDFKGAIQNLSKAVVKPPFPDTAYYLGFAFLKDGDLTAAEKWLKTAAQLMPSDSRAEYQLAQLYREQKRDEEARKAFELSEQLRQRDENNSRLKLKCAEALDKGLRKEAQATCEQLYDPDNADRLTELGSIYGQHGDLEGALQCFRRAAELAPQSPQMQYNLALTYYQLGQFLNARVPLETALRRWADLFQLNALYGAVLVKLGDDVAGYQALRHAQELNPQDSGTADLLYLTALQLAQKSQNARDYSRSLRYLQEAAKLRPAESEPHRRMAEIYSRTAHAAEATAEQREADRLNQNSAN